MKKKLNLWDIKHKNKKMFFKTMDVLSLKIF